MCLSTQSWADVGSLFHEYLMEYVIDFSISVFVGLVIANCLRTGFWDLVTILLPVHCKQLFRKGPLLPL